MNSESPKAATANCPPGTVVIGTGFLLQGVGSGPFDELAIGVARVVDAARVIVSGHEVAPASFNWVVVAEAICARVAPCLGRAPAGVGGLGLVPGSGSSARSPSGVRSGDHFCRTRNDCAARRSRGGCFSVCYPPTLSGSNRLPRCAAFRASMQCAVYLDLLRAGRREHARGFDQIRCSVLLAWPAKDHVLPFERYGRPLSKALPSAELRTLHDFGHVRMLDDPTGIADLVREVRHAGRRFGYVRRSTASAPGRTRHPGSGKRARLPTSSVLDQSRAAERCGERSFSQWRDCGSRRPSERGRRGPRPIVVGPRSFRMPARNVPTRGLAGYET